MNEKIRILSTVGIYHGLNDGSVAVIPLLFPIFRTLFNLSYTQIGIITGGSLLIHLISQLLIGYAADGKNFRTMLSLGVLLMSISMLALTLSQGFLTLVLFMFFQKFAASFFHPIGVGWVSRTFKKNRLDWAMGMQSGSADVGAFIAIITTLFLSELYGWEYPILLWSFAAAIVLLLGIFITRNVREKNLYFRKRKQKKTLKESIDEAFCFMKKIKLLIPAFMIGGSAWGVIITYLPLLLDEKTTLSLSVIGLIVAIWIGVGSISSFMYGRISSFLGRKKAVFLSYFLIGIMCILIAVTSNIGLMILIMILLGFSVFITYPALFSFISEITHESVEGRTFGIVFTLQLGGGTLLLFLGGVLSDIIGIWVPFALLGIFSLLFTIILLGNYKKPLVST